MLEHFAKKVDSPDEMPAQKHFAILIFKTSTTHVPGDERSRTAPGHGYPAHDVTNKSYEYWAIRGEKSLKDAIEFLEERKKEEPWKKIGPYQVIEASPMRVQTRIEVEIGKSPGS